MSFWPSTPIKSLTLWSGRIPRAFGDQFVRFVGAGMNLASTVLADVSQRFHGHESTENWRMCSEDDLAPGLISEFSECSH